MGIYGKIMGIYGDTRPGDVSQFANLKMAIEIVDLPMKNGESFHSYGTVYQRVSMKDGSDPV